MEFAVFDLHCDTALALLGDDFRQCGSLRSNAYHIDLERASKLPGYVQCFACFTTEPWFDSTAPVEIFEREMASVLRELDRNQDLMRQAFSAADIESNRKSGLMSAILTIEGPAGFGYDPALLEDLYNVGFRISTLGWNERNPLAGSNVTGGGLTEQGAEYIKEAQRLGMIIDVSHISDEAFWKIMDITQAPIVATHSNSRACFDCNRNLTDDMFLQICKTGGVTGINLYSGFLGERPDLNTVCDHILHFLELDPVGEHVALGGDLDGCEVLPSGFSGVQDYPKLADALLNRGVGEQIVKNIFWNNAMGVMKRCCM